MCDFVVFWWSCEDSLADLILEIISVDQLSYLQGCSGQAILCVWAPNSGYVGVTDTITHAFV